MLSESLKMWASQVVLLVRNLPTVARDARDMGSTSGLRRSLKQETESHSSILAIKSHGQRSLAGYSPWVTKELDTTEHARTRARTHTHTHTHTPWQVRAGQGD